MQNPLPETHRVRHRQRHHHHVHLIAAAQQVLLHPCNCVLGVHGVIQGYAQLTLGALHAAEHGQHTYYTSFIPLISSFQCFVGLMKQTCRPCPVVCCRKSGLCAFTLACHSVSLVRTLNTKPSRHIQQPPPAVAAELVKTTHTSASSTLVLCNQSCTYELRVVVL